VRHLPKKDDREQQGASVPDTSGNGCPSHERGHGAGHGSNEKRPASMTLQRSVDADVDDQGPHPENASGQVYREQRGERGDAENRSPRR